jgi:uncharacterized protein YwqG
MSKDDGKSSNKQKPQVAKTAGKSARAAEGFSKRDLMAKLPKEMRKYTDNALASQLPFIAITLEKMSNIALTQSKVGGYPYFPIEMDFPLDSGGKPLDFLAQVNFAEIPVLEDYPTSGIVQFFIARTESYGKDFGGAKGQIDYRVIYHENTNLPARESFPELDALRVEGQYTSPNNNDAVFGMQFKKAFGIISSHSFSFNQFFKNEDFNFFTQFEAEGKGKTREVERAYNDFADPAGNKVGGYPGFCQDDPRFNERSIKDWQLLFQLDSGNGIMWGDMGVGNFFISNEDLKNKDFSKVYYYWDCS